MPTISLCMIVKNEEAVLKRCLDSICDLMDEIIIVDTGSTDKTREIAESYTDKVFSFTWNQNFSDARNYSIEKASCDYIYTADADEVLDKENHDKFLLLKKALVSEVEIVQMLYCGQYDHNTVYNYDEEYRPKLFKRCRSFRFIHPVHEILQLDPVVYDSDIRIFHKPHDKHTGRDLAIFASFYGGENAPAISSLQLSMYAKEIFISGSKQDLLSAIPVFEKAFEQENRSKEDLILITAVLAKAYRSKGDFTGFFKYAMKCTLLDGCSEVCVELGQYYASIKDTKEAQMWYYNAINECVPSMNVRYGKEIPEELMKQL